MKRGILGMKKDPKNQILFTLSPRVGDEWPSEDSEDSDYSPEVADSSSQQPDHEKLKVGRRRSCKQRKTDATGPTLTMQCESPAVAEKLQFNSNLWGDHLPHLVLRKIYWFVTSTEGAVPFLCRASRVCRLWNQVAVDNSLWKKVDLSYGWIKATDNTLKHLCETRLSQLQEINLSNWKNLTANGLQVLADSCPQLASVNLSYCRVNSAAVLHLVDKCQNLSCINLSSSGCAEAVSSKTLKQALDICGSRLHCLNLSRNLLKGYDCVLEVISSKCPNLQVLDLSHNAAEYQYLRLNIEKLQHGCPMLKKLRLICTYFKAARATEKEQIASPGFPNLQELSLGQSKLDSGTSGEILNRLLKNARHLKLLDLRGWSQLTCDDLHKLAATDLQQLYISQSSIAKYEGIQMVMTKWRHSLVDLDISWNIYPGMALDIAMTKLASDPSTSKLEILDLTGTQISAGCVKSILHGCPNLNVLDLSSCRGLPRGMKRRYSTESIDQLRCDIDGLIASDSGKVYSILHG